MKLRIGFHENGWVSHTFSFSTFWCHACANNLYGCVLNNVPLICKLQLNTPLIFDQEQNKLHVIYQRNPFQCNKLMIYWKCFYAEINLIFWNIICVIFCPASMSLTKWVSGLAINCNLGKKFFKLTRYFDDLNWMKLNSIVHDLLLLMLINGLWLSALRSTNLIIICNANLKAPKCLMKISLAVMKC